VPTASGIFVGGEFSRPMPQSVFSSITLVDTVGLDDPRFQGYADVLVNAIQANGNTLTLGGIFTNLGNQINSFNGLGRVNWTTGFAGAWVPFPDTGAVETMVLDPATGDLIVGGSFRKMGLNPAFGLARFKGTIPGSPAATVTTPLAGSSIELGSTFRIEWTSSAPSPGIQSADVYVSQTGTGGPWRLLAAGLVGRNSYDWVIDGTYGPSTNNHVRVDVRDWYGNLVSDLTNASFNVFVNVVTDVDPGAQAVFALRPLVPNPVRGSTRVSFVAPKAAHVTLSVLDIQGRTLAVLADAVYAAGTHEVAVDAASLPAGLCFLQMRTPTGTLTRRFVTLR
jgi:hypothetical protein